MYKRLLYRSSHRYADRLTDHCRQMAPEFDVDKVHDMRTSVKEYRALLRWAGKDKCQLPGKFKRLYRVAGEIRNTQVLAGTLEKEGRLTAGLQSWMQVHLALLEGEWSYYCSQAIRQLKKRSEKYRFKKVGEDDLAQFIAEKRKAAARLLLDPTVPDDQLHELRKLYKDMSLVIAWYDHRSSAGVGEEEWQRVKEIGRLAGELNDIRVGLELLQAYRVQWWARGDQELAILLTDWEAKRSAARQALMDVL